jgi:hypothetical protein
MVKKTKLNFADIEVPSSISLTETYYNYDIIKKLSRVDVYNEEFNAKIIDDITQSKLNNIIANTIEIDDKHTNKIVYNIPEYNMGRLYANRAGYQNMPNFIRKMVINGKYHDIDLVNSQISILSNICESFKINCSYVKDYAAKRDEHLDEIKNAYNVDREIAKTLFTILLFGGCYDTWIKKFNIREINDKPKSITNFASNVDDIIKEISKKDIPLYKECVKIVIEKNEKNEKNEKIGKNEKVGKKGNNKNLEHSAISIFLQEIEKRIIYLMIQFFQHNNFIVGALIHDGIYVEYSDKINEEMLERCKKYVYDKCGFKISLKDKLTIATPEDIERYEEHLKLIDTENKKIFDLCFNFDTRNLCNIFYESYKNKFIYQKSKLYVYNGVYWKHEELMETLHHVLTNDFKNEILNKIYKCKLCAPEKHHELINDRIAKVKSLGNMLFRKECISDLIILFNNDIIKFDEDWNYFAFTNKIFDLKVHKFIDPCPLQYISLTTGYDYCDAIVNSKELDDFIDQVFPLKEEKDLYLTILATTLEGRLLEKLIISNGNGGNGKGVTHELLRDMLGNYYYKGNNNVLLNDRPLAANPDIANIDKKRCVIYTEPDHGKTYKTETLKSLTGDKNVNARMLYSNETNTRICSTTIIECNEKCPFDNISGIARRLIDVLFRASFKDGYLYEEHKNEKYVYKSNIYYKSKEFIEKNKVALFHKLIEYHKTYSMNDFQLEIPNTVRDRTKEYLKQSDYMLLWFEENYEKSKDGDDYVKISDMYHDYLATEQYTNKSKLQKRTFTKDYFKNECKNHPDISKNYYDRLQIKSKNIDVMNVIRGYKIR